MVFNLLCVFNESRLLGHRAMISHKIELCITTTYGFKLGNIHMHHFQLGTVEKFNNKHFIWNTTKTVVWKRWKYVIWRRSMYVYENDQTCQLLKLKVPFESCVLPVDCSFFYHKYTCTHIRVCEYVYTQISIKKEICVSHSYKLKLSFWTIETSVFKFLGYGCRVSVLGISNLVFSFNVLDF